MDQELKKLLKKNLELTREMHGMIKYIKKYILFQQVLAVLKVVLIVIPLVLGIIYLPPLLSDVFDQYRGLLNSAAEDIPQSEDSQKNLEDMSKEELLQKIRQLDK